MPKVGIVGLGGTGSYVLDFVSKAPVGEIHIFDKDKFSNHNAFRAPGAASLTELNAGLQKVTYYASRYSHMHRHIIPHGYNIDETNVSELDGMNFVFVNLDAGSAKQLILDRLEASGVSFVDVGMGIQLDDDGRLGGIVRATTSTPAMRDHVRAKARISFGDGAGPNDYDQNIQVAELNALNAALAVIKWKKLCGFYRDLDGEHFCAYTLDGNCINNEDKSS